MEVPIVSVVIPTYKRIDTLPRAIDSVLNQTFGNLEVLIVDDNIPGSEFSRQVVKLIKDYSERDSRVKYVGQKEHFNGAMARNVGVYASRGEYIAFLDDDDEWLPDKLKKQVDILDREKMVGGVSCLYTIFLAGKEIRRCASYSDVNLQLNVLLRRVAIYTSTFICRKNLFLEAGGFDINLGRHQDLQMFIDFMNYGKIKPINEHLVAIYADSGQNRPDVEKLISVKKFFFESISDSMQKYDDNWRRRIVNAHRFEIVVAAVRCNRYLLALKYLLMVGFSIESWIDVTMRYMKRC